MMWHAFASTNQQLQSSPATNVRAISHKDNLRREHVARRRLERSRMTGIPGTERNFSCPISSCASSRKFIQDGLFNHLCVIHLLCYPFVSHHTSTEAPSMASSSTRENGDGFCRCNPKISLTKLVPVAPRRASPNESCIEGHHCGLL